MKKAVSSKTTKRGGRFAWGAAALCTALGLSATPSAEAQNICNETSCPPTFTITEKPLQKVPTTFKFQSRISQAKIPVGDAKLAKVIVNVKRGADQPLCTETLTDVMVRDSVLNIEIGRSMTCQLDEVIANNNDLSFQVCIGGTENCLKPVSLGTVPQAIKASFAVQAQEAYKAQIAAQSHYAHRITPDADMTVTNGTITRGYYDFQTPTTSTVMLDSLVTNPQTHAGGFVQWTPVTNQAADNVLHISSGSKTGTTRTLKDLTEFYVHAGTTRVMGALNVRTGATVQAGGVNVQAGGADITGGITVRPSLGVSMNAATIQGATSIGGTLTLTPPSGSALVVSNGGASVAGGLTVSGPSTFAAGATTTFNGDVVFNGTVNLPASGVSLSVTSTQIVDGTIATVDLANGAVNTGKIAANSINSVLILDSSIVSADIADATVTSADLADNAVGTAELASNAVTNAKIADGTIINADIANDAITSAKIDDGSVTAADIAGSTITGAKIAQYTITANRLDWVGTDQTIDSSSTASSATTIVMPGYACFLEEIVIKAIGGYCNQTFNPDTWGSEAKGYRAKCRWSCIEP